MKSGGEPDRAIALQNSCIQPGPVGGFSGWRGKQEAAVVYLLRGASHTKWEHRIPSLETLWYSVAFGTLRKSVRKAAYRTR